MIVLKCSGACGQVAFAPARFEGRDAPERHYDVIDGYLAIDDADPVIAAHDAAELTGGAHPAFRLASPDEQNEYAAKQKKSKNLREKAQPSEAATPPSNANGG